MPASLRRFAVAAYLQLAGTLVLAVALSPVTISGDSGEYLLTLQSFWNHGTPDARPGDVADTLAVFPFGHPDGQQLAGGADGDGWVKDRHGRVFGLHFWAMPVVALPAKAALRWLGGSELAAVPVTNALLFATAVGVALFAGGGLPRRRLLFVGLSAVSPVVWYIGYGGLEVFCWSLAVLGLVAFDRRRHGWSAAAFGLAAMHNPPLAALLVLPVRVAVRSSVARAARVAALGFGLAAVPVVFYLWRFGQPSLLTPFADPALVSWTRTLGVFFDLNQGLLPYCPVLVAAVSLGIAAAVRRGEWRWVPAALAVAAMVGVVQMQVNWNGDGRGMLRYLVWMLPPLAWVAARGLTGWMAYATLGWAVLIQGGIVALDPPTRWQYLEERPLAAWVMSERPTWYNPEPELFVERQTGREIGPANVSPHLPVLFGRSNGEVTKVLLDRGCMDRLAGAFERIDPNTLAAMRAAAESADRPTYFHPAEKTAWGTPWRIHGKNAE